MKTAVRLGGVGVLVAVAAGPAWGSPVPVRVQREIAKRVSPLYAYVPTRLPAGWHLTEWDPGTSTNRPPTGIRLNLWFEKPGNSMGFQVSPSPPAYRCRKPGRGAFGKYRINGVTVYWGPERELTVWRCVRRGKRTVELDMRAWGRQWAADRVTPIARRHAHALARVLATARRLR